MSIIITVILAIAKLLEQLIVDRFSRRFQLQKADIAKCWNELVADEINAISNEKLTKEQIEKWAKAPAKGGLTAKAFKAKAREYGITNVKTKEQTKLALRYLVESGLQAVAPKKTKIIRLKRRKAKLPSKARVERWFLAPAKGGLGIKKFKAKARACGIDTKGKTKFEVYKDFLYLIDGCKGTTNNKKLPCKKLIAKWALTPKKGGLPVKAYKEQAQRYGVNTKGLTKAQIRFRLESLADSAYSL